MRVPDDILKCVAFFGAQVCEHGREFFRFGGTGFFVSFPSEKQPGARFHYLVTAKHVVEGAEAASGYQYAARINASGGTMKSWASSGEGNIKWWVHPTDKSVDVAVTLWQLTSEEEIKTVPVECFLGKDSIEEYGIGPGDEVFFPGCFTLLAGEQKNYPIVRTGNIAMMPGEPIPNVKISDEWTGDMEAYLIEARSVGGLSGSPVFARETIGMSVLVQSKSGQETERNIMLSGEHHLLGLAQSHWSIDPKDKNQVLIRPDPKNPDRVHLGVSLVVPSSKILEVLNHPELIEMRKQVDEREIREKRTSEPDCDFSKDRGEANQITRQEFELALGKASRKLKPSESAQEKPGT